MNICIMAVATYWHGIGGGMEIHGRALVRGLTARGHQVTVLTTRHPKGVRHERQENADIEFLEESDMASQRGGWARACARRFEELHQARRFDVLCCQHTIAPEGVLRTARRARIPVAVIIEGLAISVFVSEIRQARSLRHGYGALPRRLASFLYYYLKWELPVLRRCDAIIAVSDEVAGTIRRWTGVHGRRLSTVYNGVDTGLFRSDPHVRRQTRAELGVGADARVVLFLSQLSRQKGLHLLIQTLPAVLRRHSTARLLVVGDGEYRAEAEALASRLGVAAHVIFAGRIEHETAVRYFNAADLFVLPTLRYEGLPFSLLEAMACRRPVIASRLGGIRSVIEHGRNGWLVRPDDQQDLFGAVDRLLADQQLADTLAEAGHATVTKQYSTDTMVEGTLRVLQSARERLA